MGPMQQSPCLQPGMTWKMRPAGVLHWVCCRHTRLAAPPALSVSWLAGLRILHRVPSTQETPCSAVVAWLLVGTTLQGWQMPGRRG